MFIYLCMELSAFKNLADLENWGRSREPEMVVIKLGVRKANTDCPLGQMLFRVGSPLKGCPDS